MDRAQRITYLTTNSSLWKDQGAQLSGFSDELLASLVSEVERGVGLQTTLNTIRADFQVPAAMTLNAIPAFVKGKAAAVKPKGNHPNDDEEADMNNGKKQPADMTSNISERLTPDELATWNAMTELSKDVKAQLVEALTANVAAEIKPTVAATYNAMDLKTLRTLVSALPVQQVNGQRQTNNQQTVTIPLGGNQTDFRGAGGTVPRQTVTTTNNCNQQPGDGTLDNDDMPDLTANSWVNAASPALLKHMGLVK